VHDQVNNAILSFANPAHGVCRSDSHIAMGIPACPTARSLNGREHSLARAEGLPCTETSVHGDTETSVKGGTIGHRNAGAQECSYFLSGHLMQCQDHESNWCNCEHHLTRKAMSQPTVCVMR
jgi:hypothetical protein